MKPFRGSWIHKSNEVVVYDAEQAGYYALGVRRAIVSVLFQLPGVGVDQLCSTKMMQTLAGNGDTALIADAIGMG
jgi:hypothetical protein